MKIKTRNEWKGEIISKPGKIAEIVRSMLAEMDQLDQDKEHIWTFHLNAANELESVEHVNTGIIVACVSHPREIYRRAVMEAATIIIIAHNHPSNNPKPSTHDNDLTETLARAGNVLGIPLIDHIIVTTDEFYSYREDGKL